MTLSLLFCSHFVWLLYWYTYWREYAIPWYGNYGKTLKIFFSSPPAVTCLPPLLLNFLYGRRKRRSSYFILPIFHLVLGVTNIQNLVPHNLLIWKSCSFPHGQSYSSAWSVHNILCRINARNPKSSNIDDFLWKRLDAIIKQCIYSPNNAQAPPQRTHGITYLTYSKTNIHVTTWRLSRKSAFLYFLSRSRKASTYCQQLKNLSHQLYNCRSVVWDSKLDLQQLHSWL